MNTLTLTLTLLPLALALALYDGTLSIAGAVAYHGEPLLPDRGTKALALLEWALRGDTLRGPSGRFLGARVLDPILECEEEMAAAEESECEAATVPQSSLPSPSLARPRYYPGTAARTASSRPLVLAPHRRPSSARLAPAPVAWGPVAAALVAALVVLLAPALAGAATAVQPWTDAAVAMHGSVLAIGLLVLALLVALVALDGTMERDAKRLLLVLAGAMVALALVAIAPTASLLALGAALAADFDRVKGALRTLGTKAARQAADRMANCTSKTRTAALEDGYSVLCTGLTQVTDLATIKALESVLAGSADPYLNPPTDLAPAPAPAPRTLENGAPNPASECTECWGSAAQCAKCSHNPDPAPAPAPVSGYLVAGENLAAQLREVERALDAGEAPAPATDLSTKLDAALATATQYNAAMAADARGATKLVDLADDDLDLRALVNGSADAERLAGFLAGYLAPTDSLSARACADLAAKAAKLYEECCSTGHGRTLHQASATMTLLKSRLSHYWVRYMNGRTYEAAPAPGAMDAYAIAASGTGSQRPKLYARNLGAAQATDAAQCTVAWGNTSSGYGAAACWAVPAGTKADSARLAISRGKARFLGSAGLSTGPALRIASNLNMPGTDGNGNQ